MKRADFGEQEAMEQRLTDETSDANASNTTDGAHKPRRRPVIIALVAIIGLIVAVAVPLSMWMSDQAEQRAAEEAAAEAAAADQAAAESAATEDAAILQLAIDQAESAAAEFEAALAIAGAQVELVAVPVRVTMNEHPDEFDTESAHVFEAAIAALDAVRGSPFDESDAPSHAMAISDLTDSDDHVEQLKDRYVALSADEREEARTEIAAEAARLNQVVTEYESATLRVTATAISVDEALQAVVTRTADVGASTLESLTYAADDAKAALQASIDGFRAFGEIPVTEWDGRTTETPSPLAGATEAVGGYVAMTAQARTSHTENTPAPSGGSSGGGNAYACMKYSWTGTYIGWCTR